MAASNESVRRCRVALEIDVEATDAADLLVELYRRFGERDGWMLREAWLEGGRVDVLAMERRYWPEAAHRIQKLKLAARCDRPGCSHKLRFDGRPVCCMTLREKLVMVRDTLRAVGATIRGRRTK